MKVLSLWLSLLTLTSTSSLLAQEDHPSTGTVRLRVGRIESLEKPVQNFYRDKHQDQFYVTLLTNFVSYTPASGDQVVLLNSWAWVKVAMPAPFCYSELYSVFSWEKKFRMRIEGIRITRFEEPSGSSPVAFNLELKRDDHRSLEPGCFIAKN